ncbi:MAG: type II toxin-antitoxin system RelE/ParE family toxin [Polaribacter sp.]|uniref:type II toxin-antitoxin system RelE/ParE family toxin n=1 Tax=Polaribacter sp. TaxID=1920175 RepID=UPI002F35803D
MVQINWTYLSKNDLKDIAEYISKDSKVYAKLQITRIRKRAQILKTQLYSGKIVDEFQSENFRELIEGNYRIIYKIVSNTKIDIITIHHSSRNLSKRKF